MGMSMNAWRKEIEGLSRARRDAYRKALQTLDSWEVFGQYFDRTSLRMIASEINFVNSEDTILRRGGAG